MLVNQILGELSVDDLNQRYGQSYIKYKDRPAYVNGFGREGGETYISFASLNTTKTRWMDWVTETFDHTLLDTQRPISRWYFTTNDEPRPFFLLYYKTRQWSRGITNRIVNFVTLDGRSSPKMHEAVTSLFDPECVDTGWRIKVDLKDVITHNGNLLLSPFLLVTKEKNIYYKNKYVARVEGGSIVLNSSIFEQEISECISEAEFTQSYEERPTRKKSLKTSIFRWDNLEVEREDDPPRAIRGAQR